MCVVVCGKGKREREMEKKESVEAQAKYAVGSASVLERLPLSLSMRMSTYTCVHVCACVCVRHVCVYIEDSVRKPFAISLFLQHQFLILPLRFALWRTSAAELPNVHTIVSQAGAIKRRRHDNEKSGTEMTKFTVRFHRGKEQCFFDRSNGWKERDLIVLREE